MEDIEEAVLRKTLELGEYEAAALDGLLRLGRTTAPNLAEATGIPNARIYGILDDLGNAGYVKIIPGRPKEYEPKKPSAILEQATENRRQEFEDFRSNVESMRDGFLEYYRPLYENADDTVSTTEELFYVVDVGEPSERQTREMYQEATATLHIMTKSFEYLDDIEPALEDALEAGVTVRILFTHPEHLPEQHVDIQREILDRIETQFPAVEYRFSETPTPWRGTIADPNREEGTAIFLVGEKDIPLHMRQAAITEDESFIAGMNRYFELIWEHESVVDPD
jgi:sugar-specific transcriptional regulator TrmB